MSQKSKKIIKIDRRYTIRDIAKVVGILQSQMHLSLYRLLKVQTILAGRIQHFFRDDKKGIKVQTAENLLEMCPKLRKRQLPNIVTHDKTRVHYFDALRKDLGMFV